MRRLLTYLAAFSILSVGLLAFASRAGAVDVLPPDVCSNPNATQQPVVCKDNKSAAPDSENPVFGPNGILTRVISILSFVVGIISVFVIIIAGIKLITSSGDPSSVTNARNTLLYAVIALTITVAAQASVRFILNKF